MTESPQLTRVRNARSGLLLTHPFFGVLSLKLAIREELRVPTAGVNAKELVFNPTFIDGLSNVELKGLIAHEVMHLALCHHARQGKRDPQVWNIACDYSLNPSLVADGFTLPEGGCIDPKFNGMTAEAIYEKLMADAIKIPMPQGWGEFDSAGPEDSAEAQESAREWQQNAADAMRAAKSAGKMPAGIAREIEESLAPKADWRSILRRFMTDQVRSVPTWSNPNKRFYPGTYLPGRTKTGMGPLVIGVDTSGSIDAHTLAAFSAEITAIAEDVEPSEIHVVYCDAEVNRVDSFEYGDDVKLTACGGGGTRFVPVFERIEVEGWQPAACVYLTDLMCSEWPKEPAYPVLWASYGAGGAVAPVGETVAIDG